MHDPGLNVLGDACATRGEQNLMTVGGNERESLTRCIRRVDISKIVAYISYNVRMGSRPLLTGATASRCSLADLLGLRALALPQPGRHDS